MEVKDVLSSTYYFKKKNKKHLDIIIEIVERSEMGCFDLNINIY